MASERKHPASCVFLKRKFRIKINNYHLFNGAAPRNWYFSVWLMITFKNNQIQDIRNNESCFKKRYCEILASDGIISQRVHQSIIISGFYGPLFFKFSAN